MEKKLPKLLRPIKLLRLQDLYIINFHYTEGAVCFLASLIAEELLAIEGFWRRQTQFSLGDVHMFIALPQETREKL